MYKSKKPTKIVAKVPLPMEQVEPEVSEVETKKNNSKEV